jgi:hypothetical protein
MRGLCTGLRHAGRAAVASRSASARWPGHAGTQAVAAPAAPVRVANGSIFAPNDYEIVYRKSNQPLTRSGRADAGDDGGLLRALAKHPLGDGP